MSEASPQHRNEKIATISLRKVMPQNFSGKNLRGRNFKGQNLTGAKFIGADIRGANFTNAILIKADFTRAKAGLQRRWTIFLVTVSLFLSVISGLMSGLASFWVAILFTPDNIKQYTIIPGVVVLIVLAIFFMATIRQNLEAKRLNSLSRVLKIRAREFSLSKLAFLPIRIRKRFIVNLLKIIN
ncbi:MAG: pentapeptide repeat-containing protein [Microcoleus sp.]